MPGLVCVLLEELEAQGEVARRAVSKTNEVAHLKCWKEKIGPRSRSPAANLVLQSGPEGSASARRSRAKRPLACAVPGSLGTGFGTLNRGRLVKVDRGAPFGKAPKGDLVPLCSQDRPKHSTSADTISALSVSGGLSHECHSVVDEPPGFHAEKDRSVPPRRKGYGSARRFDFRSRRA